MLSDEIPGRPEGAQVSRRAVRRRRRRKLVAALIVLLAGVCVASARLFIWPAQGMPARVDAIVVLGGPGNRLGKGLELAHQDRAPRPRRLAGPAAVGPPQCVQAAGPRLEGDLLPA